MRMIESTTQQPLRDAGAVIIIQREPQGKSRYFGWTSETAFLEDRALFTGTVELVERVMCDKPARLQLDIDHKKQEADEQGLSDEDIDAILESGDDVGRALGIDMALLDIPSVFVNRRELKDSAHIRFPWGTANGSDARRVIDMIVANLVRRDLGRLARMIDVKATSGARSYGLRLPFTPKNGDNTATLLPSHGTIVQRDEPEKYMATIGTFPTVPLMAPMRPPVIAEITTQTTDQLTAFLAELAAQFPQYYPGIAIKGPKVLALLQRREPAYCRTCMRTHDRVMAYVKIDKNQNLNLYCQASPGRDPLATTWQPTPGHAVVDASCKIPADEVDELIDFETVGDADGQAQYNSIVIKDDGVSDIYAGSAWGTGKTNHYMTLCKTLMDKNPKAAICIVSCRISLTNDLAASVRALGIPLHMYSELKGPIHPMPGVLIIQVDSVKRIVTTEKPYDLLIEDELNGIVAHCCQLDPIRRQSSHIKDLTTLSMLARATRRIIISDNDLTTAQVRAIQALRPGKPSRVYRNAWQPWKGRPADIDCGTYAHARLKIKLDARLDAQNTLRDAGAVWGTTVVPCHSRRWADALAAEYDAKYGDWAVKLYTGEVDDAIKKHDFSNVDSVWGGETRPLVIIFTGTVSVGVSCTSPLVNGLYAFFEPNNAAVPQSAQMLARARAMPAFHIAYKGEFRLESKPPTSAEELAEWVVSAQQWDNLPDTFRYDRNGAIAIPNRTPNEFLGHVRSRHDGNLWFDHELEKQRSKYEFVPRLKRLLERAGIVVSVNFNAAAEDDKNALDLMKKEIGKAKLAGDHARAEVMAANVEAAVDRQHFLAEQNQDPEDERLRDKTRAEKLGMNAMRVLDTFGMDAFDVETYSAPEQPAEWYRYYEKCAEQYRNLQNENAGVGFDATETCTASTREATAMAHRAVKLLGGTLSDPILPISKEVMTAPSDELTKHCIEINRAASRVFGDANGPRRLAAKGGQARTITASLNVALSVIGAHIEAVYRSERDRKRKTPTSYCIVYAWSEHCKGLHDRTVEVDTSPTPIPVPPPKPWPPHPA